MLSKNAYRSVLSACKCKLKFCRAFSQQTVSNLETQERYVRVGDYDINYMIAGKGAHKVLFTPGAFGTMWTDFKYQLLGFDMQRFTLVAWDPPGCGKTRPLEREFDSDLCEKDAQFLYEFTQALNIGRTSMVAWSYGGIYSLIVAAKYPELVEKLVVVGSKVFNQPHELEAYKRLEDVAYWSKTMRAPMIKAYSEDLFLKYWPRWLSGMIKMMSVRGGDICSEILKDIQCPTLVMQGGEDQLVDLTHSSYLHKNIANSKLCIIPDGKHNIQMSHPEVFNKVVQEFLLAPIYKQTT